MRKLFYEAPALDVVDVAVEQGFAASIEGYKVVGDSWGDYEDFDASNE